MALVYTNTAKVAEDPARLLATSEKEGAPGSISPEAALFPVHPEGLQQSLFRVLTRHECQINTEG
jgi:hypothetical protein